MNLQRELFHFRRHVKSSGFLLHHRFQTPQKIGALALRPCALICLSVFGAHDETVALVFDIQPPLTKMDTVETEPNCPS